MANELVSINSERTLTPDQYRDLADVPPETEWLANLTNEKTKRFYKCDVAEFIAFTGLKDSAALRTVARYRLAQGHGDTFPGRCHDPAQAIGTVIAV